MRRGHKPGEMDEAGMGDFEEIELDGGELRFYPAFFTPGEADDYLQKLLTDVRWRQQQIRLFGKVHDVPRLTAWHGDRGADYAYSGIRHVAEPWSETLLGIKRRVELAAAATFNSVLLNLYRTGRDSNAWHSDDERELGDEPVIASVSLGQQRRFQMRHKQHKALRVMLDLPHGSLLMMRGRTQCNWMHQVPKSKRPMASRINLTFRTINQGRAAPVGL